MIYTLSSTLPSFKRLDFAPGLNLLVARKTQRSTDRQTRNGAGKTSFVELVHFLLGASNSDSNAFLRKPPALEQERFSMAFDLGRQRVEIERAPGGLRAATAPRLVRGDTSGWPVQPMPGRDGFVSFTHEDWRALLGTLMFGLPTEARHAAAGPSFRMAFSYFARRDREGGFQVPERFASAQQLGDQQITLTYLLGLDAAIPAELQGLRKREAQLKSIRSLMKEGALRGHVGPASQIFTELTVAEKRLVRQRQELSAFRVIERYVELQHEADALSLVMVQLGEENEGDAALVLSLEAALGSERSPRFADVKRAFDEVSIVLPDLVRRRFEDVDRFHASVVRNRRSHLEGEITSARARMESRRQRLDAADRRRAEILRTLRAGGALEQYTRFQAELTKLETQVERLRLAYEQAQRLEGDGAELKLERSRIFKRLKDDHAEQFEARQRAIEVFESLSEELYEDGQAGSLVIGATENGPTFDVKIPAGRSSGKNHMQIFCFDLMLLELAIGRGLGPGFLIHDSALYDGVDGRQVGRALALARTRAEALGFQYIVTINEDALEQAQHEAQVDLRDAVLPVTLTDEIETGGLFGLRFD